MITIVDILGSIDDKIENNEKIIKKLDYYISLEFCKYFSNYSGVNSKLSDFIYFQEGPGIRNWQYVDDGINFINIRCINNSDIDTTKMNKISYDEANGIYKHFLLNEWDFIMSMSGTLGRYAIVRKCHLPLCLNTSVIRFYPKDKEMYSFMYGYLTSQIFNNAINNLANGSAQLNVGPTHLEKIKVKIPDTNICVKFNQKIFPILEYINYLKDFNIELHNLKNLYLKKFFD